jgi:hypothetical protein
VFAGKTPVSPTKKQAAAVGATSTVATTAAVQTAGASLASWKVDPDKVTPVQEAF